ncbi:hypothetical protein e1116g03.tmp0186 [Eimeria tenella]|uniref:Uncharacterized protein n=1 Tax=Eimeria tenella TaxID=5802 RepID=C8TE53_EIMTE|nr:hypothetical protein e1116g03.tmp0186 [Eimeria tenella]
MCLRLYLKGEHITLHSGHNVLVDEGIKKRLSHLAACKTASIHQFQTLCVCPQIVSTGAIQLRLLSIRLLKAIELFADVRKFQETAFQHDVCLKKILISSQPLKVLKLRTIFKKTASRQPLQKHLHQYTTALKMKSFCSTESENVHQQHENDGVSKSDTVSFSITNKAQPPSTWTKLFTCAQQPTTHGYSNSWTVTKTDTRSTEQHDRRLLLTHEKRLGMTGHRRKGYARTQSSAACGNVNYRFISRPMWKITQQQRAHQKRHLQQQRSKICPGWVETRIPLVTNVNSHQPHSPNFSHGANVFQGFILPGMNIEDMEDVSLRLRCSEGFPNMHMYGSVNGLAREHHERRVTLTHEKRLRIMGCQKNRYEKIKDSRKDGAATGVELCLLRIQLRARMVANAHNQNVSFTKFLKTSQALEVHTSWQVQKHIMDVHKRIATQIEPDIHNKRAPCLRPCRNLTPENSPSLFQILMFCEYEMPRKCEYDVHHAGTLTTQKIMLEERFPLNTRANFTNVGSAGTFTIASPGNKVAADVVGASLAIKSSLHIYDTYHLLTNYATFVGPKRAQTSRYERFCSHAAFVLSAIIAFQRLLNARIVHAEFRSAIVIMFEPILRTVIILQQLLWNLHGRTAMQFAFITFFRSRAFQTWETPLTLVNKGIRLTFEKILKRSAKPLIDKMLCIQHSKPFKTMANRSAPYGASSDYVARFCRRSSHAECHGPINRNFTTRTLNIE